MKLFKITPPHIKQILLLLLFVAAFIYSNAQTTDSARLAIDNILAPLDKSQIPTGILAENTYNILDLATYNGQLNNDNTLQFSEWRLLYSQLLVVLIYYLLLYPALRN